ncbi:MAG TPA: ABC transporter ATP-binding protein [Ignavibacteria bacterium]|nr:ABC transporter ATP-binding protein [Ignavibacteria bacterium]
MLELKNIIKSFRLPSGEQTNVLNIPSFILQEKEQLAIYGRSGSGKSTFLNVVSGILKPDSGSVIVNNTDITKLDESHRDKFRAQNFGFVFQTFNLLQGFTALENVLLGMTFAGKPNKSFASEMLEYVGLKNKLKNKPAELSVGEQQRVAIARAIVNNPKIILADEPTANLDAKNSENVIELIKKVCDEKNISLVLVSHDKDVIGRFGRVVEFESLNKN